MRLACQKSQSIYDGDGLTPTDFTSATTKRSRDLALIALEDTVDAALTAISACQQCPFLSQCRTQVQQAQKRQIGPAGVIQAGVYWGLDGRPDFSLGGCLDKTTTDIIETTSLLPTTIAERTTRIDENGKEWPLTVPLFRNRQDNTPQLTPHGPVSRPDAEGWSVSWIAPTPRINEIAVSAVCHSPKDVAAIPASKLSHQHDPAPAGTEVLSDADVCEVIRRLSEKDFSCRSIARKLSLSPATIRSLRKSLGIKADQSTPRRVAAQKREARRRERRRALMAEKQPALF